MIGCHAPHKSHFNMNVTCEVRGTLHGSCSAGHSLFVDTDGSIYPCHLKRLCPRQRRNVLQKSVDFITHA